MHILSTASMNFLTDKILASFKNQVPQVIFLESDWRVELSEFFFFRTKTCFSQRFFLSRLHYWRQKKTIQKRQGRQIKKGGGGDVDKSSFEKKQEVENSTVEKKKDTKQVLMYHQKQI